MYEIKENDWVEHRSNGYKGWVIGIDGFYAEVIFVFYRSGSPLPKKVTEDVMKNHLIALPPEPKAFSYDELDIALLTNDKEWYEELMKLKEGAEK